MATTLSLSLTLNPVGKHVKIFSETALPNETKLYKNGHWHEMKVCDFGADRKFKMAATVYLSLTLNPMGKAC